MPNLNRRKLCHEIKGLAFPIKLYQDGVDRFTVVYGEQVKDGLTYSNAAYEFGASIMHALACDGRLDNRERKRRSRRPIDPVIRTLRTALHAVGHPPTDRK